LRQFFLAHLKSGNTKMYCGGDISGTNFDGNLDGFADSGSVFGDVTSDSGGDSGGCGGGCGGGDRLLFI